MKACLEYVYFILFIERFITNPDQRLGEYFPAIGQSENGRTAPATRPIAKVVGKNQLEDPQSKEDFLCK